MIWYLQLLIFAISLDVIFAARTTGCSIKLNADIEKNFPLILKNSSRDQLELAIPNRGNIRLTNGEEIVFACPDPKNSFAFSSSNIEVAECVGRGKLRIRSDIYSLEDIQCKKTIRGEAVETRAACGDRQGQLYKVGYKVTSRQWITLFEVCYDNDIGHALYSRHILHGEEIRYASRAKYRPTFSVQGVGSTVPSAVAYKQAYQKATFNRLFGSTKTAQKYIKDKSFLSRGHLAPDADFLFATWQYTTYYYINTAPQWQAINGGNWVRVENAVRNYAGRIKIPLSIITGTHDVLMLEDDGGNPTEVYLTIKKKLPVPKFLWKILYDEESRSAIVLVISNNPFRRLGEDEVLCESVCGRTGWQETYFDSYQQGEVHCCTYDDFRAVVSTAPTLNVRGTLSAR